MLSPAFTARAIYAMSRFKGCSILPCSTVQLPLMSFHYGISTEGLDLADLDAGDRIIQSLWRPAPSSEKTHENSEKIAVCH
jgi:hypothetical protein